MNFSGKKRRAIFRRFTAILFDALASCGNRLKLPFRLPVRVPFKQKTGEIPLYFPLFHCKAAPIALSSSYMIEEAPEILPISPDIIAILMNPAYRDSIEKVDRKYLYWDKAKFYKPKEVDGQQFWTAIHFARIAETLTFGKKTFRFKITNFMHQLLHEFDVAFT